MNLAVQVANAALCEAGQPDLAERATDGKLGHPRMPGGLPEGPVKVVALRAFLLGHLAAGHDDHLCPDSWGRLSIHCSDIPTGPCEGPAIR